MRYAVVYIIVTSIVLVIVNLYCSGISQRLFYQSKHASMIEKCLLASAEVSDLEVLNPDTAATAVAQMGSLKVSRLIITDQSGAVIYDSLGTSMSHALLPEIVRAMEGNNVFSWQYRDGAMRSCAATPVYSYGVLTGCVYMMEYDTQQGALIQSLQQNILTITIILEVAVILFSFAFALVFSRRIRRIMATMRVIQEGDYTQTLIMDGSDELAFLASEVNDLTEQLKISEEKRSHFVSDASHELKTPLASIKLLSDSILQNDMDMETVREFVTDIGNEADRLNRMSQKLLSLSRIESQQDGDCEIIHLTPTLQRVERMLSGIAEKNNITLKLEILQDCPILMLEDDLYQIIFNLVENGIKYNVPGGKLTLRLSRDKDNAIVKIIDTGVGIPKDAIGHVFERFYRVDKARSRKSGGSGLGLAIVRNMVERNQGTIHVDSTVGVGTAFTVTFPAFDIEEETP
ncbi:MAG: HAMP domain-containing histidine kinase [Ruminococcaceae bacterium]|nr:HAMP domain-containing histidine kinase [Oscillospiraceae bacterium]